MLSGLKKGSQQDTVVSEVEGTVAIWMLLAPGLQEGFMVAKRHPKDP